MKNRNPWIHVPNTSLPTGKLFTDYSDHLANLSRLNPKLKSTGAGRCQLAPLVGCLPQAAWLKDFSRKVRTLWQHSRLRSVALYLWLIVVISSGNRPFCSISGLHCRALVMVSSSIRRQPDCKIQRSGRNGQRDWCMSRVTAIISALVIASSSACHGLLIITVITLTTYKAQRDKNARGWSWRTRQLLTCRCVSVMLLRSLKYRRVSWCWTENDALRDVAAGRRRLHIKAVCQSVREATTRASGVDNAASPTGRHRWTGLFHPQREADHYAKTTEGTQGSILMSSADRVARIDGQLATQLLWAIHTRFQRSINA